MKHINQYIRESLLDDEDEVFNNAETAITNRILPELFKKWVWMEDAGWGVSARRAVKSEAVLKRLNIVDGRIDTTDRMLVGQFTISEKTIPIPEDISLEYVPAFCVCGDNDMVKQCWDQLPRKTASFSIYRTQHVMDDFRIQCYDCLIGGGTKVKNLTLDTPKQRGGLRLNDFDFDFEHLGSESDLKNIKINGVHNIIVKMHKSTYGVDIAIRAKKEVAKLRKKNPDEPINNLFLEAIKKIFPFDWIDKHWKGVRTIILKLHATKDYYNGSLHYKSKQLYSSLTTGDCALIKEDGEWKVVQKMMKDPKYSYYEL